MSEGMDNMLATVTMCKTIPHKMDDTDTHTLSHKFTQYHTTHTHTHTQNTQAGYWIHSMYIVPNRKIILKK